MSCGKDGEMTARVATTEKYEVTDEHLRVMSDACTMLGSVNVHTYLSSVQMGMENVHSICEIPIFFLISKGLPS